MNSTYMGAIVPGVLRAFDANDLSRELWNSQQNGSRDQFGNFAKFNTPVVANGKVYLATFSQQVAVYGLLPRNNAPPIVSARSDPPQANMARLVGSATDDGFPKSPGGLKATWLQVSVRPLPASRIRTAWQPWRLFLFLDGIFCASRRVTESSVPMQML